MSSKKKNIALNIKPNLLACLDPEVVQELARKRIKRKLKSPDLALRQDTLKNTAEAAVGASANTERSPGPALRFMERLDLPCKYIADMPITRLVAIRKKIFEESALAHLKMAARYMLMYLHAGPSLDAKTNGPKHTRKPESH